MISMHRSRRGKYVVQAELGGVFDLKPRASGGWSLQRSQTSRLSTRAEARTQLWHKLCPRRAMRRDATCNSIIAAQHWLALAQLFEKLARFEPERLLPYPRNEGVTDLRWT